jgi:WXG100 family type VII secretion target
MAVRFKVNPQELAKQAQTLQELNERFKTEVTTMTEKEQALSSMWEGEARNAFHNAYATDVEKFQNFYAGIARFVEALVQAAQEYVKAEQTASSIAAKRA